ncbi:MAG: triose-phosphate isomerase [Candidatus Pacebacteria bacterium]|nr:triose-phosphate isomerase [Candidatus Paceibacterota bacterium]
MKKRLVVGNWKMYVENPQEAHAYALQLRRKVRGLSGVEVWVAPPYPFVPGVAKVLESSPVHVGAQDVAPFENIPHTGAVSAKMLKNSGALFVIVGHSERRAQGESEQDVRAALERAAEAGLAPILCIGETEREKDGEHVAVLERQLTTALDKLAPAALKKLVVAYEPVWAIGKHGVDAIDPAGLEEMVIFIKKVLTELTDRTRALKVPILYGGSVEADNAAALLQGGGINGFLVGHASTKLETFFPIIQACK